ncbi:MAG: L-threonylcarbamoyladenylate synthase [Candidatus Metalachnospira sp.]|nr:L-threonylcarbamoyladenylate synthase [Candidatus Metalachnospira sp.]
METKLVKVDAARPDLNILKEAAEILKNGGLVAFPTETVYGLGANGLDENACKKIYEAKGRPSDNPLILTIGEVSGLYPIVSKVTENAEKIIKAFWPGPITLVLPKAECVPLAVTGGLDTVAIRFPSNTVARELIKAAGIPVAAPSANSSGKPSPTRASHVEYDLNGKINMIIDGGPAEWGLESTILDVSVDKPVLLRPGAITKEMIEVVVGEIDVDPAVYMKPSADIVPKAPGMKYKHYSPAASVTLVSGSKDDVIRTINEKITEDSKKGLSIGIMATEQTKNCYKGGHVLVVGDRNKPETIGANLFKILRKFDYIGVDVVYSEVFDESGEGAAIMNRLNKAAAFKYIRC